MKTGVAKPQQVFYYLEDWCLIAGCSNLYAKVSLGKILTPMLLSDAFFRV